ncbi:cation transporter [Clostridium sp. YIM B02515]|uniref:Cation transporter n=1 Tax=Clostridium rhizosphaerae TaxID=2803861 RepID=A0ABS1TGP8_9CLOT|nr:cation diffusion facilitator family transporter [Clostridium rhizosphaerae]MBL4938553.1 cation transporter [Clostridium rhizosphaerae]
MKELKNKHHDVSNMNISKLLFVVIFNFIITLAELIGGLLSGSLSLLSDALHNLSDTAAILLSYVSMRIASRPISKERTYGHNRANILSAFVNASVLIGISGYLFVEAFKKFINPSPIEGNTVVVVAIIGLLGNLFSVLLLRKGSKDNINMKSSYLHLLSDTFSSVAVIISGFLIKYTNMFWIDPILTVFINIIIIKSSYAVLKESIQILMEGTPEGIDIEEVIEELKEIQGIKAISHIHIWRLDENNINLEAQIQTDDMLISETQKIYKEINDHLHEHFDINHAIIQFVVDEYKH